MGIFTTLTFRTLQPIVLTFCSWFLQRYSTY